MKVYCVMYCDYEGDYLEKIFSTKEKADKYIEDKNNGSWSDRVRAVRMEVEEVEVHE